MPARLTADTSLLRHYGAACAAHANDLDAVAARLNALGPAPAFGPVGARFVAALVHAVEREAGTLARLSASVATGSAAAMGSAAHYETSDDIAATRLTG
jgi:hypothetical protein